MAILPPYPSEAYYYREQAYLQEQMKKNLAYMELEYHAQKQQLVAVKQEVTQPKKELLLLCN